MTGLEEKKIILPARVWYGIVNIVKGGLSSFKRSLGQLATKAFWTSLIAMIVKEMIAAFMKTLGGKFLTYGVSREDPEIKKAAQSASAPAGFSNNYNPPSNYTPPPRSDFRSQYSSSNDTNFPGFGHR